MKKYSFLIRLIIFLFSVVLCAGLMIGIFTRANTLALKAKLDTQKIVLSIEKETQQNQAQPSNSEANLVESNKEEIIDPKPISNSYPNMNNKKAISIVITNLGLSKTITDKALTLPSEVTLGFSPYAVDLDEYLKRSASLSHDSLINLPMETKNYPHDDPGPLGLLKESSHLENFQKLETILGNHTNYVGIYSNREEVFSDSHTRMQPFLKYLQTHNLIYVYGGPLENQSLRQFSEQMKFKLLNVDLTIDENIEEEHIKAQIALLEKITDKQGYAVGFANAYPVTMEVINEWLPTLEKKDIYIVPISILNKKIMDTK